MSQSRPLFWLRAGQTISNSFVLSAKQSSRTSNFNVFCLTRAGIEPPTSRMPGTLNYYTTRPQSVMTGQNAKERTSTRKGSNTCRHCERTSRLVASIKYYIFGDFGYMHASLLVFLTLMQMASIGHGLDQCWNGVKQKHPKMDNLKAKWYIFILIWSTIELPHNDLHCIDTLDHFF